MNNLNNMNNNFNDIMMNLINQNMILQNQMINMMMEKNQQNNFLNEEKINIKKNENIVINDAFPGITGPKINIIFEQHNGLRKIILTPINTKVKDLIHQFIKTLEINPNVIDTDIDNYFFFHI